MMLFFSKRKKLEQKIKRWCDTNYANKCIFNAICFLEIKGLLNEEKINKLLEED